MSTLSRSPRYGGLAGSRVITLQGGRPLPTTTSTSCSSARLSGREKSTSREVCVVIPGFAFWGHEPILLDIPYPVGSRAVHLQVRSDALAYALSALRLHAVSLTPTVVQRHGKHAGIVAGITPSSFPWALCPLVWPHELNNPAAAGPGAQSI